MRPAPTEPISAVRNNDNDLAGTTDPRVWAERFVAINRDRLRLGPGDVDYMMVWFAGAIETGRMAALKGGAEGQQVLINYLAQLTKGIRS